MAYSKQKIKTNPISKLKTDFFEHFRTFPRMTPEDIEREAGKIGQSFLLEHHRELEAEFNHLFSVLQKQKDEDEQKYVAFWSYCYLMVTLLETYHHAYIHKNGLSEASFIKKFGKASKDDEFKQIKDKIKRILKREKEEAQKEEEFIASLKSYLSSSLRNLLTSPAHLSQIRDYVAYSNLCRVYWVFCRLTLVSGFSLAKDLGFIDKLDEILGTHTDVDKIINGIKAPNGVLNYFSVGLFLIRFIIDAGYLIQHTFFPKEDEKYDKETGLEISAYSRFKSELYKRHCNFANDLVWATVNFLTNFNHITHIPDPTAGAITAVFLGFDVCMALYKCHLAKQEYLIHRKRYEKEMEDLNDPTKFPGMTAEERLLQIKILQGQLKELEIDWQTKEGTFYFVAAAASLLMLGFTASLLFTGPGIAVACFFVCTIAVAMYLSSGAYSKMQEKSLRLEYAKDEEYVVALAEYEAARNDFIFTMIKNTIMPTLLIATWATCWPAGIVLTALYIAYEMYHASEQHESKKEVARLALKSPVEEYNDEEARETDFLISRDEHSCCF